MTYSTVAVANAFIERGIGGQIPNLSPMKLQKLIFFAQSWSLRIFDRPLVDEFFAKWEYGPVIPSLYHSIKEYGSSNVNSHVYTLEFHDDGGMERTNPTVPSDDVWTHRLIDSIVTVYGCMPATYLSRLTHLPGSAWSQASIEGSVIDNKLLKDCIIIEEGRFFGARDFGFHFDIDKMECRVKDDFVTVPNGLQSVDDMDKWLDEVIAGDS